METLAEFKKALYEIFEKLNTDQQEAIELLMYVYEEANEHQIDTSTYQEDIDRIFRKCRESGDYSEIKDHLITLILDFRSRAA